jgi:hypothetical protein
VKDRQLYAAGQDLFALYRLGNNTEAFALRRTSRRGQRMPCEHERTFQGINDMGRRNNFERLQIVLNSFRAQRSFLLEVKLRFHLTDLRNNRVKALQAGPIIQRRQLFGWYPQS